jgi:hypothetical protein
MGEIGGAKPIKKPNKKLGKEGVAKHGRNVVKELGGEQGAK